MTFIKTWASILWVGFKDTSSSICLNDMLWFFLNARLHCRVLEEIWGTIYENITSSVNPGIEAGSTIF